MREEVWTELVPNEDAGFTYLASTRGNKCFGISTLPLLPPLPSPSSRSSGCSFFGGKPLTFPEPGRARVPSRDPGRARGAGQGT